MAFPYYPTYQPQMYQNQYQQQNNGLIWVQGIEAAKSYPVSAGQSVLLMDSESNSFFIKSADQSGMPLPLRIFDYSERNGAGNGSRMRIERSSDNIAYVTREEFEAFRAQICGKLEKEGANDE